MKWIAVIVALLAIGCGTDSQASDKVVSVTRKCQRSVSAVDSARRGLPPLPDLHSTPEPRVFVDATGKECEGGIRTADRLEIVIRSAAGGSYVVEADPSTTVTVGQRWP